MHAALQVVEGTVIVVLCVWLALVILVAIGERRTVLRRAYWTRVARRS